MPLPKALRRLVAEPPPAYLFEVSASGIAMVDSSAPQVLKQEPLPADVLRISPSSSNMQDAAPLRAAVDRLAQILPGKRNTAGLVLPDFATRMAVLEFDELPEDTQQRASLIRFRLRKSVPFPIDEAQLSFATQRRDGARVEVLTVAIDRNVLGEYEGVFSNAGFRVGLVTPSCLACLPLCKLPSAEDALTLLLKLNGSILTVLLLEGGAIRLVRCADFSEPTGATEGGETTGWTFSPIDDSMPVLSQTLAYVEDELGRQVNRLLLSGFGEHAAEMSRLAQREFGLTADTLRSRFGMAQSFAGVIGLAEEYAA